MKKFEKGEGPQLELFPRRIRRGWKMMKDDYELVRPALVNDRITVPEQSHSIRSLLERVKRGMPLPGNISREASFGDEHASHDDVDLEKVNRMEMFDREELVTDVIARKDSAVKQYQADVKKADRLRQEDELRKAQEAALDKSEAEAKRSGGEAKTEPGAPRRPVRRDADVD